VGGAASAKVKRLARKTVEAGTLPSASWASASQRITDSVGNDTVCVRVVTRKKR
jgi:hypothetical protein